MRAQVEPYKSLELVPAPKGKSRWSQDVKAGEGKLIVPELDETPLIILGPDQSRLRRHCVAIKRRCRGKPIDTKHHQERRGYQTA